MSLYHFGDKEYNSAMSLLEEGIKLNTEEPEVTEEGVISALKDTATKIDNVLNTGISISGLRKLWTDGENYKTLLKAMPTAMANLSDSTKLSIVKDLFKNSSISSIKKFIGSSGEAFVPGGSDKDKAIAFFDMLFDSYFNPNNAKNSMSDFKSQMATKFKEIAQATKKETGDKISLGKDSKKIIDKKVTEYLDKKSRGIIEYAAEFLKSGEDIKSVEEKLWRRILKNLDNEDYNDDGTVSLLDAVKNLAKEDSSITSIEEALIDLVGDEIDELLVRAKNQAGK